MTSGMIASAAIFSSFIAPAKATIAATIVMHQVLHCALLPASRVMTAWIIFRCSIAAGLSARASGDAGFSVAGSDIIDLFCGAGAFLIAPRLAAEIIPEYDSVQGGDRCSRDTVGRRMAEGASKCLKSCHDPGYSSVTAAKAKSTRIGSSSWRTVWLQKVSTQ